MDTASRSTPEAKLRSPPSPISKISEATPDSGASQEKATCLNPVKPQPHVARLPPRAEAGRAHPLCRDLVRREGGVHRLCGQGRALLVRTLDPDVERVVEGTGAAEEVDPVRVLVADEVVRGLDRVERARGDLEGLGEAAEAP